ncbi:hypothetical protein E2C01_056107 [Portunus trituberculatus]|uniref:Uncharacterized protein n=1 Tax=Portunus trituberculatus TaxID=210409 RepID=A0A5B7GY15_PORTR|nr:hypothetical protein [Portunus trituberculatus]
MFIKSEYDSGGGKVQAREGHLSMPSFTRTPSTAAASLPGLEKITHPQSLGTRDSRAHLFILSSLDTDSLTSSFGGEYHATPHRTAPHHTAPHCTALHC